MEISRTFNEFSSTLVDQLNEKISTWYLLLIYIHYLSTYCNKQQLISFKKKKNDDTNLYFFVHCFQVTPSACNSATSSNPSNKYVNNTHGILPYFRPCSFEVDL